MLVRFVIISMLMIFAAPASETYARSTVFISEVEQREVLQEIAKLFREEYLDSTRAKLYLNAIDEFSRTWQFGAVPNEDFALAVHRLLRRTLKDYHLGVYGPTQTVTIEDHMEEEDVQEHAESNFFKVVAEEDGMKRLQIQSFEGSKSAIEEMYQALREASEAPAIMFDLRGNRGGDAKLARLILDCLLTDKTPLHVIDNPRGRYQRRTEYETSKSDRCGPLLNKPIAVLVDHSTASTAELFAFLLQNKKRATIVGEQTIGAAHSAEFYVLPYGFGLMLPIGYVRDRISNEDWEGVGVTPDYKTKPDDAAMVAVDVLRHVTQNRDELGAVD